MCRAVSFVPEQKVQQVGRRWEMLLVVFSLFLQAAVALLLVYLNLEEARRRDSGPGRLSFHDTDVPIPWRALCHGGPAPVVLNTNPPKVPCPLVLLLGFFSFPAS